MLTDPQIIDGFEGLRREFLEWNPGIAEGAAAARGGERAISAERTMEAWLAARLGPREEAAAEGRALRAIARRLLNEQAARASAREGDPPEAGALLRREPKLMRGAAEAAKAIHSLFEANGTRAALSSEGVSAATPLAEAAAWSKAIPGLDSVKAWRFMAALGRAVVIPEAGVHRFLWRLGLLNDEKNGSAASAPKTFEALARIERVTGLDAGELDRLIAWHTRRARGLRGAGRCGAGPKCAGCAFAASCAWGRMRGSGSSAGDAPESRSPRAARDMETRWESAGIENVPEAELLAALLGTGVRGIDPRRAAEAALRRFEGLRGMHMASQAELKSARGIGPAKALQIRAALELGRRLAMEPLERGDAISASADVWRAYGRRYRDLPQEHLITLLLDTKHRVIATHLVSIGTLSSSPGHPREVFKEAIRRSAAAIILMHNHPSGDPEPSREDRALTEQLAAAGKLLGIKVLDHIILGGEHYFSFRDRELIS